MSVVLCVSVKVCYPYKLSTRLCPGVFQPRCVRHKSSAVAMASVSHTRGSVTVIVTALTNQMKNSQHVVRLLLLCSTKTFQFYKNNTWQLFVKVTVKTLNFLSI